MITPTLPKTLAKRIMEPIILVKTFDIIMECIQLGNNFLIFYFIRFLTYE